MYKHVEKACDRREHMIDEKLINIYIFGIDQSSREKLNIEMDIWFVLNIYVFDVSFYHVVYTISSELLDPRMSYITTWTMSLVVNC